MIEHVLDVTNEAALAREITELTTSQLPEEKREAERAMIRTARELQERGSDWADGRGQAIGSIPPRVYMRWAQEVPGFWQNKEEVDKFLVDNPQCCAPGYRPRPDNLRHGINMGGVSVYESKKAKINASLAS